MNKWKLFHYWWFILGLVNLKLIWNLIQTYSEDNYEFSRTEKRTLETHTLEISRCILAYFSTDLELQWNSSLIYYNP